MEQYDTGGTPDPFARSVSAFESLTTTLSGRPAGEWTHAELEEHLDHAAGLHDVDIGFRHSCHK